MACFGPPNIQNSQNIDFRLVSRFYGSLLTNQAFVHLEPGAKSSKDQLSLSFQSTTASMAAQLLSSLQSTSYFSLFLSPILKSTCWVQPKSSQNHAQQTTRSRARAHHRHRLHNPFLQDHFPHQFFLPLHSLPNQLSSTKTLLHLPPSREQNLPSYHLTITKAKETFIHIHAQIFWGEDQEPRARLRVEAKC